MVINHLPTGMIQVPTDPTPKPPKPLISEISFHHLFSDGSGRTNFANTIKRETLWQKTMGL